MRNATTRSYFPTDAKSRLVWANNHLTALDQLAGVLDVPAAWLTAAKADLSHLEDFYAWRDQAAELAREYTQAIERAEWDIGGEPVITQPHDPATLGIDKTVTIVAGLYRRLFANIDVILQNPKCTAEVRRQLFILPPETTAPDLLALSPNARAYFTGGEVILQGRLPKPARFWRVTVDRADGAGAQVVGTVAGAKFTDHHELPAKPATWTYTVELRDKQDVPLGKVSVVSLTVWHGSADHGPEGAGA
ncbi:hypothetical protein OpiT1DRAFT_01794 [Opitutaceae bacterium TAV1]|nr:hypothetical protein OpiT1DRAFT_01794 [Opitutaceae bacterium TAV1]